MRLAAFLIAVLAAVPAAAQNTVPGFSHGPTFPFYLTSRDSTGDWNHSVLGAGAGYSFNFNTAKTWDGRMSRLTFGFPVFASIPEAGEFSLAAGATAGTLNNLLSVGGYAVLINTRSNTGAFLGNFRKQDFGILVAIGFNFGGGSPPEGAGLGKAGGSTDTSPPPNFLAWGG